MAAIVTESSLSATGVGPAAWMRVLCIYGHDVLATLKFASLTKLTAYSESIPSCSVIVIQSSSLGLGAVAGVLCIVVVCSYCKLVILQRVLKMYGYSCLLYCHLCLL